MMMGYENQDFEVEQGPSWARPNWPLADTDDGMDPTQPPPEAAPSEEDKEDEPKKSGKPAKD